MNLANKLTLLRIGLVPVFIVTVLTDIDYSLTIAACVFIVASITDFLDGYIARKYNMISNFGKFMDPLADKILVASALISMVELGLVPSWMVILIISREFAVSILRAIASSSGIVIAASKWGKYKTISQIIAIIMVLLQLPFYNIFLWVSLVLTIYSGYDYIYVNKDLFKEKV
ncbi:CDP-diacylglycerol--glycerol-3-phosphate 3-phosphatidyltransferase [Alkalithermobacter thermoalcaliphilus JW-YL-7 = DSM 7308]|uniref:CDP-diacylglycerol--glycerol-3-phosphate 3-phosphatidyltransferase n=1 Tax=Alkalithermobacter thermoalcaliphilus JW-YL-7 = DSM 7308 TaxID=1121328 RepID=A0A150FQI0_CLOPD|nr:CDP-diacylglycerol/glycerol-3-phosphate 3-phosphatidyltransferase [[Clostridium] paradoxum JW-YL-7 = DSM 7308]SHK59109.1 CDP-diacylglycerol--glycerol-3-phosphate 3-phosphatidyltransferase [[Clostridium] paradoxum JW-YL-7 = DSM 7308]